MIGVKPCPYCGGEVEVVKLVKRKGEKQDVFRIQCYRCKALVARGQGFPIETLSDAEDRIRDYYTFMDNVWNPESSRHFQQSEDARKRDRLASYSSRIGKDDEWLEMHDAPTKRNKRRQECL